MHRGEVELIALHQQDAGLDTTKIHGHAMNDGVEELVELKDGADLLCRFLQRHQGVYAALLENCRGRSRKKLAGSTGLPDGAGLDRTGRLGGVMAAWAYEG